MFEPDDLRRTGIASARSPAVHGALPLRAQSSGPGKPASAARIRHCPTPSSCSTPTAPRRNAQLLPSGRSLTNVDCFFGQFGRDALFHANPPGSLPVVLHKPPTSPHPPLEPPFSQADTRLRVPKQYRRNHSPETTSP